MDGLICMPGAKRVTRGKWEAHQLKRDENGQENMRETRRLLKAENSEALVVRSHRDDEVDHYVKGVC